MRDRSILGMLLQDSKDGEIAAALHVTEGAIRLAIHRLVRRLQVQSREDLTRLLLASGIDALEQRLLDHDGGGNSPHHSPPRFEKAPEFDAFWMLGESPETPEEAIRKP